MHGNPDRSIQIGLEYVSAILYRPLLQHLPQQGGQLSPEACKTLMRLLDVSVEELMIRLLPLAKVFSMASVSNFHVGAVALAKASPADGHMNLYLGANMEFEHLALNMTIHAEQVVVINAWHHGARRIKSIAVSELPCGHCRQFLQELCGSTDLMVLKPVGEGTCLSCRSAYRKFFPQPFPQWIWETTEALWQCPKTTRHLDWYTRRMILLFRRLYRLPWRPMPL